MKKILLIIALTLLIFQMVVLAVAIDIGDVAEDRSEVFGATFTCFTTNNPANESGTITSVEIYAQTTIPDCEVATFYNVGGSNFSTRDTEAIGTVTQGSIQTFDVNLTVEAGDYIGIYGSAGNIERTPFGDNDLYYRSGDNIPCTNVTFTNWGDHQLSVYGTGTTEEEEEANAIWFGMNF